MAMFDVARGSAVAGSVVPGSVVPGSWFLPPGVNAGLYASAREVNMPLLRDLIGAVLRRRRLSQGRTLREVAGAAQVSMPYLSELERGRKEASSEVLAAICRALGITLDELLDEVIVRSRQIRAAAGLGRPSDAPAPPVVPARATGLPARTGAAGAPEPTEATGTTGTAGQLGSPGHRLVVPRVGGEAIRRRPGGTPDSPTCALRGRRPRDGGRGRGRVGSTRRPAPRIQHARPQPAGASPAGRPALVVGHFERAATFAALRFGAR
jgi:transcriptional regulator with XRE-family HTH domain